LVTVTSITVGDSSENSSRFAFLTPKLKCQCNYSKKNWNRRIKFFSTKKIAAKCESE